MDRFVITALILGFFISCGQRNKKTDNTIVSTEKGTIEVDERYEFTQADEVWTKMEFDSSFAYLYSGGSLRDSIVINEALNPTTKIQTKRKLTADQIRKIRDLVNGRLKSYPLFPADCFIPSHGFVFYNEGEIKAHISICYLCGRLTIFPKGNWFNIEEIAGIFKQLKLPIYRDEDEIWRYNAVK
jgi:hypothetical protein